MHPFFAARAQRCWAVWLFSIVALGSSAAALAQEKAQQGGAALSLEELGVSPPGAGFGAAVDLNASDQPRRAANYLWPLVDVLSINLALWSVSYATGASFAKISPSTWQDNLANGFQWDDNEFEVNQLAHPYQGGMYFSAARVNGLSFWEAVPYTMFGAGWWEYFMETEQPSTNDWATTTWGGWFFGESLYRLSNNVLDESASGSTRLWRELAAFAINPINGLDRVVSGRAWSDGPPSKRFPLAVNFRLGPDGIGLSEGTGWGKSVRAAIRFDYGDPYAEPSIARPFEAFHLAAELSLGKEILGEGVDGTGVLMGRRFSLGESDVQLLAWVLSFEYFTNGTTKVFTRESAGIYQVGEMGTGAGWLGHWPLGAGFSVDGEVDALGVPTGAITSPYAKYEANRSYNYGVGGALKLDVELRQKRLGRVYAQANRYLYYVVDGARGLEHLGLFRLGLYVNLYRGHGLGAAVVRYDRTSDYDAYPDLSDAFWSGQAHYELEF